MLWQDQQDKINGKNAHQQILQQHICDDSLCYIKKYIWCMYQYIHTFLNIYIY